MIIRPYTPSDCAEILSLFYETVHCVNCRDYTAQQLDAWAPAEPDCERWQSTLAAHCTLVAQEGDVLVGFADMDRKTGYLDRLYVHKDFQRRGVASGLCDRLETLARSHGLRRVYTEASITARPFFEARGYIVVKEQQKPLRGQLFCNYIMYKQLERTEKHE